MLRCIAFKFSADQLLASAAARDVSLRTIQQCAAALVAGQHLVILASDVERGLVLAEAITSVARQEGLCLGTVTLTAAAARLLTIRDLFQERFRGDFWLLVTNADSAGVARVADNLAAEREPPPSWRAIVISAVRLRTLMDHLDAHALRKFAVIDAQ
jgi:hypothetical protein